MDNLADFNTRVTQIIKDSGGKLDPGDIDSSILSALRTYNKDRPLIKVRSYSGDNGFDYPIPTSAEGWVVSFSIIKRIELPAGEQEPSYIPDEEWVIYQDENGFKLRFLFDTPSSAETFKVQFTAQHTIDSSESTIFKNDEEALSYLAASLGLMVLANHHSQFSDSTIGADVVEYRAKSDQYSSRAKEHAKKYLDHIHPAKEELKPAILLKEYDTSLITGERHLTHDPNRR